jgi:hypothetical protein
MKAGSKQAQQTQRDRFIEAAREAGCSEDEAEIREEMKRIAEAKVEKPKTSTK